jgi:hypothetical protein
VDHRLLCIMAMLQYHLLVMLLLVEVVVATTKACSDDGAAAYSSAAMAMMAWFVLNVDLLGVLVVVAHVDWYL